MEQVSERESALRSSEGLVRNILAKAGEGIITTDNRGVIETFNRAAQLIFGFNEEEVIGSNVSILMPTAYRVHHDKQIQGHLENPSANLIGLTREVEAVRKNGEVFHWRSLSPNWWMTGATNSWP